MNIENAFENGQRITRREAIRRNLYGAAGLMLAGGMGGRALETDEPPAKKKVKAKSVIQVFLWGGMSHNDTWDPKPDSGYDYMGEFAKAIPTNVSGIHIGSLFPELAKQADKFSMIRSMTHRNNGHETAAYLMQTGHTPGERLAYPSIGAVFSMFKGSSYKGIIPPYVVLTQPQGRFPRRVFLGQNTSRLPRAVIPMAHDLKWKGWCHAASAMIAKRPGASFLAR